MIGRGDFRPAIAVEIDRDRPDRLPVHQIVVPPGKETLTIVLVVGDGTALLVGRDDIQPAIAVEVRHGHVARRAAARRVTDRRVKGAAT